MVGDARGRELADEYGLALAKEVSRRSTCARRRVGAVLIYPSGGYAIGFNWERNGQRCDEGGCPRGRKTYEEQPEGAPYDDCVAQHAEAMALSFSLPSDVSGYTMYVTEEPCSDCAELIGKFPGLRVVVAKKGDNGDIHQRSDGRA